MTETLTEISSLSAEDVALTMRAIRDARSRIAEEVMTCNALRKRLEDELALIAQHEVDATKADRDRIAYFEGQLTAHLLNKRAADPNIKSIPTPWGTVSSVAQPPEYRRDDKALKEWMLANGWSKERRLVDIDWEGLKKACHVNAERQLVTDVGEIVPGVEVIERGPKVTVEVEP
jgi:hypothetical protein